MRLVTNKRLTRFFRKSPSGFGAAVVEASGVVKATTGLPLIQVQSPDSVKNYWCHADQLRRRDPAIQPPEPPSPTHAP